MTEPSGFVELDRRFRELGPQTKPEDSALSSYAGTLQGEPGQAWEDLLKRRIVIVLGEPGSGKTWEFEHRTNVLISEGKFGFYIRLDQLTVDSIERILGPADYRRFQNWRASAKEATFFLDSVDEAKFTRLTDFYTALRRFSEVLGAKALPRTRILLTCRISEWQPQRDSTEVLACFPSTHPPLKSKDGSIDLGSPPDAKERLLVVQIEPLDRKRVISFARALNVDAEAFAKALDEHHAWDFSRRPIDVVELANYWITHGRLGSLTELIEDDITRKLRPSSRDVSDPLSEKEARDGAEALGAATVLCRQFNFKVPDDAFLATEALDPFSCLPRHWRKDQIQALLSRAIFDSASYGRIRFHHRRVAECLAAQWIAARMREGCPTTELKELLFDFRELRPVIRPALAPVVAWLCCGTEPWNEELRGWVLEASPEIHLQYGDPNCLSLDYKRKIFESLVRLFDGRHRIWLDSSADSLKRLADPALAGEVSAIIRNEALAVDLRAEMLQLVRHGRLQGCLEAAVDIIASSAEPDELKSYAAAAIRDMGDPPSRQRLANIVALTPHITNKLCARVCEALYPGTINARGLIEVLQKAGPVSRYSVDLPYYLKSHLESALHSDDSEALLKLLIDLGQTSPHLSMGGLSYPVSQQFWWVGQVVPTVLKILIRRPSLTPNESQTAASALWWLGLLRHDPGLSHDNLGYLDELTTRHPSVRQGYFWRLVAEWRHNHGSEPTTSTILFEFCEFLRLQVGDLQWLVNDIGNRSDLNDREIAMRQALELWNATGRRWRDRRRIKNAVNNDQALAQKFRLLEKDWRWMWFKRMWYQHFRRKFGDSWWWKRRFREMHVHWIWLRDQVFLLRHVNRLASGKRTDWLVRLVTESDRESTNQWTPTTWEGLRKRRGRIVAWAVKKGCKSAWRLFIPRLPHEKTNLNETDNRVIVGLAGLQAAFEDGDLNHTTIVEEDAKIATRYAVNELNGFAPWLIGLAAHRPDSVRQVLSECIRGEWQISPGPAQVNEVMADLEWHGENLVPLVQDTMLALLRTSDPANHSVRESALSILLRQKEPPRDVLAAVAETRVSMLPRDDPGFVLWLAVWLQVDAEQALNMLEGALSGLNNADQIIVGLCALLLGERHLGRVPTIANPSYLNPRQLRRFIPLVYRHVKPNDDIHRAGTGAFYPEDRDHAQSLRDSLLPRLAGIESLDATKVLRELQTEPALAHLHDWILHLGDEQVSRQADLVPWTPLDLRIFEKEHEIDPKSDYDLYKITCKRLREIKYDVEKSDNSLREELRQEDTEPFFRRWLARKLKERSRRRYTVPQEEEIDLQERPDLRVENPRTDPVSIEVKWADRWTLNELLERLENQLIGQYLRAHNSCYGVYLLGMFGHKEHWENPSDGRMLTFEQVLSIVKMRAGNLVTTHSNVKDLAVIGIDFRGPSRKT